MYLQCGMYLETSSMGNLPPSLPPPLSLLSCQDVNAAKPVKLDDLQAFWDMVQLQVEGLYSKFAHLEKLEQNSWHPVATERTNSKRKKGGKVCWGGGGGGENGREERGYWRW